MSEFSRSKRPRARTHPADETGSSDYEVGYGRPPTASQFKPGQCGNPKGRPKKSKTIADSLEREFNKRVSVIEKGQRKHITKRDLAARQIADAACRGDTRAFRIANAVMDVPGSSGRGQASAQVQAASPIPIDQDDRAILAAFAALFRSGGMLPDEAGSETALQEEACAVDRDATARALDAPASSTPTRH